MGADGGVTLFDRDSVEFFLSKDKNKIRMAEYICQDSSYLQHEKLRSEKIANALLDSLDDMLNEISGTYAGYSSIKVKKEEFRIIYISFGTNVPSYCNSIESFLVRECDVVWSGETWT